MTEEGLANRWRPATFRDLRGQPAAQLVLFRSLHEREGSRYVPLDKPQVPYAMLFTGTRGAGKTSTARILAAALNCVYPMERPCGQCESCLAVREGVHPAMTEIDAASNGTVDKIRELQELVSYDCGHPYRVVLLDECHRMSAAGFDALLKLLEEPPPATVFVLLTTEIGKVPKTIVSRCHRFPFYRIAPAVIRDRLGEISDAEGIGAEPALLAHLAEQADGGLRDGVMLLEQCAGAGLLTMAQYRKVHGEFDFGPELLYAMAKGDHATLFRQVDYLLASVGDYDMISARLVGCLKDVLVLHARGEVAAQGQALDRRKAVAAKVSARQAVRVMQVLWDLRVNFRSADPRASLELAAALCAEVLSPTPAASPPPNGNGHAANGKATAESVRALLEEA